MNLNFISKISVYLFSLCVFTILSTACSSDKEDSNQFNRTGVHKITLEMVGDKEVSYTAAFTGSATSGMVRLYDKNGDYQGISYVATGDLNKEVTEIICTTSESGTSLSMGMVTGCLTSVEVEATFVFKAYIDDKLVDELEKKVVFTKDKSVESISFSTVSR